MQGSKRIRRNPNVPRNMYFDDRVQDAIEIYNSTKCVSTKKSIYETRINPALDQLADKLIKVYDFKSLQVNQEELKLDCIAFLYESLHKWDPSRGTKAFSYFNVVAKNWLIINTRKHAKKACNNVSLNDFDNLTPLQKNQIEEYSIIPSPEDQMINLENKAEIMKMLDDIKIKLSNENEMRCLHAIETLFDSIEDLDILNKRAVRIYLREISGLDKKIISKSISSIKKHYKNAVHNSNLNI